MKTHRPFNGLTNHGLTNHGLTERRRYLAVLPITLLLVLLTSGYAQRFIFATDRDYIESNDIQSELFLYDGGSQLRLTRTLDQSEYDAALSPDGTWLAYAALTDETAQTWEYQVRGLDDDTILVRFPISGSAEMTRPAGGFPIRWIDNERFVGQVADNDFDWSVVMFDRDGESMVLSRGYGMALSPDRTTLATDRDGTVYLLDLTGDDDALPLAAGTPLSWLDDETVMVFRDEAIELLDVTSAESEVLHDGLGYSFDLLWNRERSYYAVLGVRFEQPYVLVYSPDHRLVSSRDLIGLVNEIAWLGSDTLLFASQVEEDVFILSLDLTGRETILINSFGSDFAPVAAPQASF